jgi:hypothetical protein
MLRGAVNSRYVNSEVTRVFSAKTYRLRFLVKQQQQQQTSGSLNLQTQLQQRKGLLELYTDLLLIHFRIFDLVRWLARQKWQQRKGRSNPHPESQL